MRRSSNPAAVVSELARDSSSGQEMGGAWLCVSLCPLFFVTQSSSATYFTLAVSKLGYPQLLPTEQYAYRNL
jgi:hypothetical protein